MSTRQSRSLLALAGFSLVTAGAAWYGSRYSRKGNRNLEYRDLDQSHSRSDEAFRVAWITLYALIAWSGWRVWSAAPSRDRTAALRLWISQLAANTKWSKLFLGQHRPIAALAEAVALEGAIFSYMNSARKIDRAAAGAFIPYAAWVAFAECFRKLS